MTDQEERFVSFRGGNLYIDHNVYEKYFNGIETVVLLKREGNILILPVHSQAAGGLLMKIRNAKGDRCVNIVTFLRQNEMEDAFEAHCSVKWDGNQAALVAQF